MGSTADHRSAGLLLWFVLVCRVMPRSLMFQDKLQLYKAKSSIFNSCFFVLLYVYWKIQKPGGDSVKLLLYFIFLRFIFYIFLFYVLHFCVLHFDSANG